MSYAQGEIITAADFNALANDINEVYADNNSGEIVESLANYGYGETETTVDVSVGEIITATQWTQLFSTIDACSIHQGSSMGIVPSSVNAGDIIFAYDGPSGLLQIVQDIRANRLMVDSGQVTITSGGAKSISTRVTQWDNYVRHKVTLDFGSYDNARYFFNSGGQIRFSASRIGGAATLANNEWSALLSSIGDVIFNHTETISTGVGSPNSLGFYNLTTEYQEVFWATGGFYYGGNIFTVSARFLDPIGTNGLLRFRINFENDVNSDPVSGTLTSFVDERRSSGTINKTSPIYTNNRTLDDDGPDNE